MKLIILVALSVTIFISCGTSKKATSKTNSNEAVSEINKEEVLKNTEPIYKNISAYEFKKKIVEGKGIILDVRTINEVNQGAIEGAINIDFYSSSFNIDIAKLDKMKPVYVYCRSGSRSGKTMMKMKSLGFQEVYNLIGGYSVWPYK